MLVYTHQSVCDIWSRSKRKWACLFALTLAAAGLFVFFLVTSPAQADDFAFDTVYSFGGITEQTSSVTVGDVDGDGDLDVVAGNRGAQNQVYLNDGGVSSSTAFGDLDNTNSVALGDLNGDGVLDLVVGNTGQNLLYLNDGTSVFSSVVPFGGTDDTRSIAVGDLDGDGDLDIVAGNYGQQNVVYVNGGSGIFSANPFGGADGTYSVVLGDMDGDGDLDVVVGNYAQQNVVYFNNGLGVFSGSSFGSTDRTRSVAVGDLDGNGALDLAVVNWDQMNVTYLNDGTGIFTSGVPFGILGASDSATSVTIGDLDGDGDLDIVVGSDGKRNVAYMNDGGAQGGAPGTFSSGDLFNVSDDTFSVALGDLDGSGALDIIAGNSEQLNLVYMNDGSGSIFSSTPFGDMAWSGEIVVGDLNGDGALDIVMGGTPLVGGHYLLCLNDGTGAFPTSVSFGGDDTTGMALGDLNGDGTLDLVVSEDGRQKSIYWNDGTGVYSASVFFGGFEYTSGVALGDMDGDGDLDIVVGNRDEQNLVYLNDGTGVFSTSIPFAGLEDTVVVAVGDLDGDGDLDIVAGNYGQQNVVYENDGAGGFSSGIPLGDTDYTFDLALGDLDGDGALDLAVSNADQQDVVYLNDGTGRFLAPSFFGSPDTMNLTLGDMNGDGALDIVVSNITQRGQIYLNDGSGHFDWSTPVRTFGMEQERHTDVAVGDVDGDGALDVIVAKFAGEQDMVYLNDLYQTARLANNPPRVALVGPNLLANANFGYTDPAARAATIPFTYTLFDPEGEPVCAVRAFYSMDGGGRWYPAVAATGTVTTGLPTLGPGLSFDGINDAVVTPLNVDQSVNSLGVTMMAWVYPTSTSALRHHVICSDNGGYDWSILREGANWYVFTGEMSRDTGFSVDLYRWQHVAAVFVPGIGVRFYKNGQEVLIPYIGYDSSDNNVGIGHNPGWGEYFAGQVDEVRVYAHALSGSEVREAMSRVPASTTPGLAGYWRFNEGRGSTAHDQTAYHNNGTLINGPVWTDGALSYVYEWDVFASGFFGQSDKVVFRAEAYPVLSPTIGGAAGPYQRPYASATTLPFRVRGAQVRVMHDAQPAAGAIVYRLPVGQTVGGAPIANSAGEPFHTDTLGYLQGRGQLNNGDRLFAIAPITWTDSYTLYYASHAPTVSGVDAYTVTTSGVQTLTVSSANPLVLFNLDVSLEWDARHDDEFLSRLQFDLLRASEILYDWTNGRAALGQVRVYHDREHWLDAHVRIYSSNRLRPNAAQGGIVSAVVTDSVTSAILYAPGQVHMGAVWNRYGDPGSSLGEDWPRTLAHELGHYAFYLDDNYLGLDESGLLISVDGCPGAMSDPYREDYPYDEFHPEDGWLPACERTLSQQIAGRSDWETIATFYPSLAGSAVITNPGPSGLPVEVTQIQIIEPITPSVAMENPVFYLSHQGHRVQPGLDARAFLFQGDSGMGQWLTDLGRPTLDQVLARGARVGDRVCVYELTAGRLGCEMITGGDEQLTLATVMDWQPDVIIAPVTSRTIVVSVTNVSAGLSLWTQLFPVTDPATGPISLTETSDGYVGTFITIEPALEGHVLVWMAEVDPLREIVTDYALGGDPSHARGRGSHARGRGSHARGRGGPAVSADGQVILFDDLDFADGEFVTLQAATVIPSPPAWATIVGRAYRLSASVGAPDLGGASISFGYLGSEVPVGEERWLRVYFWDGSSWEQLPTELDMYHNMASALAQGEGLYALMSSVEIPLYGPGWNMFAYPVQATRPVTEALVSLSGVYTTVYGYEATDIADPWKIYDVTVPDWVNDLEALEFGRGYWIQVSETITLMLKGESTSAAVVLGSLQAPPATYYGRVAAGSGFAPAAGMEVMAWVDGHLCGRGETLEKSGQVVYSVNVLADGPGGSVGCGAPGREVAFLVGSQDMIPTAAWDNNQVWELELRPIGRIYLPLLLKGAFQ
ncbi:MAG: VCBS repeat-containing protein [Anaerolineae bacterium]|nr:VCBS repeat-containing protein [Anaerolineae bacterium]